MSSSKTRRGKENHAKLIITERPCQRCVARKIADLCIDETPISTPNNSRRVRNGKKPYEKNPYNSNIEVQLLINNNSDFHDLGELRNLQEKIELVVSEADIAKEGYILTAADPADAPPAEKLMQVISAKYMAGLLKPHDYGGGYKHLQDYISKRCIDFNNNYISMSVNNQYRIHKVLGILRPGFRNITKTLTDMDLMLIEEDFEKLLLVPDHYNAKEYDRVFSAMSIPSCLWRRTGEIYKANKQFADLVGIPKSQLKEGAHCIYELMREQSSVNYWEVKS